MRTLVGLSAAAALCFASVAVAAPCEGFTDVDDSNSDYCSAVSYLKDKGITLGCTGTAFCPDAPVTRLQMALFLQRLGRGGPASSTSEWTQVIAGGNNHVASGPYSVIGGGFNNRTSGRLSTVAGGVSNTAAGDYSFIGGGEGNTANGLYSAIPGGISNETSASLTFAGGYRAKATTIGSFIWADYSAFDFGPSVNNFFGVRATGGVGFTVAIDGSNGAPTQFCNLLPGTPSWQCTSDRNAKENLVPANGEEVLNRLAAMPLYSYNFKNADPSIRSLGPMAQDFYAAFGLGQDNKMVASINLEGVALSAIQGLYAEVQTDREQLKAKDARIEELEQRVERIEGLLAH